MSRTIRLTSNALVHAPGHVEGFILRARCKDFARTDYADRVLRIGLLVESFHCPAEVAIAIVEGNYQIDGDKVVVTLPTTPPYDADEEVEEWFDRPGAQCKSCEQRAVGQGTGGLCDPCAEEDSRR